MPPRPDEARRERLLDQLEAMFLGEGFLHMRIGGLASRLRCSRSTLYKLAPSKEQLFVLVVERWVNKGTDMILAEAEKCESPIEEIETVFRLTTEVQSRGTPAFWRDALNYAPTAQRFSEDRARGIERVRSYLDDGIAQGIFRPTNTSYVAHMVWLGLQAARDPDLLGRLGMTQREALRELQELLLRGMIASDRGHATG